MSPVYLDCNASTPIAPEVHERVSQLLLWQGNASSHHPHGRAQRGAVEETRDILAEIVTCEPDEVIFTGGATEANNLALLGPELRGRHVVVSAVEHKSVLAAAVAQERNGVEVTWVVPEASGRINPETFLDACRPDTVLASIQHVNNETGVLQPVEEIASALQQRGTFLHVDSAQGFGHDWTTLRHPGINLIALSAHKLHGPVGVGALICRNMPDDFLRPRQLGGAQEDGMRAGTLSVPLIGGMGLAAELCVSDYKVRVERLKTLYKNARMALLSMGALPNVSAATLPNVLNVRFPGLEADSLLLECRDLISAGTGSACNSGGEPSHVLQAQGLTPEEARMSVRFSWSYLTPDPPWQTLSERIRTLLGSVPREGCEVR